MDQAEVHHWPRRRIILAGFVLLAAGAGAWLYLGLNRTAAVSYITAGVSRGAVAPYVTASGTLNPVVTIQVGTYVSGVIESLFCDFNTAVHKNQICAKIDPRPFQKVVDEEQAALGTAHAQLEKDRSAAQLAKTTYGRDQELVEGNFIAKEDVDVAHSAYEQALSQVAFDEASIKQHEASLNAAKINLGYTNIVSPVDGTVVSRNVTQGQTVAASFQTPTLFVIATDLTKMQVDANISEADVGSIAPGNEATFTVETYRNQTFRGHVVQVRQSPQTVQNVVTYDVVVEAANADLLLKPGMTAAVRIFTSQHADVLRVPDAALRYTPTGVAAARAEGSMRQVWLLRAGKPVATAVEVRPRR